MIEEKHSKYLNRLYHYFFLLLGIIIILAFAHYFFYKIKIIGIYWFNLDKERNIPTFFSGTLFFLLGSTALYAYKNEKNIQSNINLKYRFLWLLLSAAAYLMSLDEMTALHENLFWKETRLFSASISKSLYYVTQWQLLFLPVFATLLIYCIIFFSQRFSINPKSLKLSLSGLACWLVAFFLESVRTAIKHYDPNLYQVEVVFEESLEMLGALLITFSIALYTIELNIHQNKLSKNLIEWSLFMKKKTWIMIAIFISSLGVVLAAAFTSSKKLSNVNAKIPRLMQSALKEANHKIEPLSADLLNDSKQLEALTFEVFQSIYQGKAVALNLNTAPQHTTITASLSDGNTQAETILIQSHSLKAALNSLAQKSGRFQNRLKALKVDFIKHISTASQKKLSENLDGFIVNKKILISPFDASKHHLITKNKINMKKLKTYLKKYHSERSLNSIDSYQTHSIYANSKGAQTLFRDNPEFLTMTTNDLKQSLDNAKHYLIQHTLAHGAFNYLYYPEYDKDSHRYNILRHAGTIFSMLELYAYQPDPLLLEKIKLSLNFLASYAHACPNYSDSLCIIENNSIKIGGNGLALVAFATYTQVTGDKQYLALSQKIAKWIQHQQKANGDFKVFKAIYPSGKRTKFFSLYYPGEAFLGLVKLYELDSDPQWLDTAARGIEYIAKIRDAKKTRARLPHDHWLLYTLQHIYPYRQESLYIEHAQKLVDAILSKQNLNPPYPDWHGSYYHPPRSTPTATRSEALMAAYKLFKFAKLDQDAFNALKGAKRGILFQLRTQYDLRNALLFPKPKKAIGGFRKSYHDFEIRIDYVQHNISSILNYLQAVDSAKLL